MFDPATAQALLHHVQRTSLSYLLCRVSHRCAEFEIRYGALILASLGGMQFGFEFSSYNGNKGHARYALGTIPVIGAWVSMFLVPQMGFIVQLFSFVGMWAADSRLTVLGWVPSWYASVRLSSSVHQLTRQYRFWLTGIVCSSILLALGGTALYAPPAITTSFVERLDVIKSGKEGVTIGDIRIEKDADSGFVKFSNPEKVSALPGPLALTRDLQIKAEARAKAEAEKEKAKEAKVERNQSAVVKSS